MLLADSFKKKIKIDVGNYFIKSTLREMFASG